MAPSVFDRACKARTKQLPAQPRPYLPKHNSSAHTLQWMLINPRLLIRTTASLRFPLTRIALQSAPPPARLHSTFCSALNMATTATKATQDSWQVPVRAEGLEDPKIKVYNSLTRTKVCRIPSRG